MKKLDKTFFVLTLVCVIFGFFTVQVFDQPQNEVDIGNVASLQKIEDLVNQKRTLENKKQEQDEQITQHESKLTIYENDAAQANNQLQLLQKEVQEARLNAGLLPVQGPGIEIVLNDRKRDSFLINNPYMIQYFIVHDSDMLHVINELRGAGAEAIAVNGTRIMATSRISCGGPTIHIGKYERFAPPFVIQAIGDPDTLMAGFQHEDSIYHDLIAWGLELQIRKLDRVEIPRFLGDTEYRFAKVIEEDD